MSGPRTCEHCSLALPPERPNRRFCTPACRTAAYRARKASPNRHKPSGLQLSYHRAVTAVATELGQKRAEQLLADALPARQRQQLEARRAT